MENLINAIDDEAASRRRETPLDVYVVAYFDYIMGFFCLMIAILMNTPAVKSIEPWHVLFGTVALSGRLASSIYMFCQGICGLFCGWGLIRRYKFAWWFTFVWCVYALIDHPLSLPSQAPTIAIAVATDVLLIAWLWFRRELYGVRVKRAA